MQIPDAEKMVLTTCLRSGDHGLRVVSALRRYREIVANTLNARYSDGECDSVALHRMAEEASSIEEDLREEGDDFDYNALLEEFKR